MVKVVFTETQHVRNARKTVYEKDQEYDLPEASVQRWEGMGVVERVKEGEAKSQEKSNSIAHAEAPYARSAGPGRFNVFDVKHNKINDRPLMKKEADALLETLAAGATEEEEKDDDQKA